MRLIANITVCAILFRRHDPDFAVVFWLVGAEAVAAEQFENCQEHADDFAAERGLVEEAAEGDAAFAPHASADLLDVHRNGRVVVANILLRFHDFPPLRLRHTAGVPPGQVLVMTSNGIT